eukprot:gnl/TRDRNA2_/TRDRNA2_177632_c0_seq2.p1 gnl/TRDRNA2_/TRDRNA2_177632_c0~~gnl/TRDRNA2_/TRDRNA2_177632_c0_seq2.p1  ORF type:complete len:542 (+),score=35.49 gnl/TRDRNA2_/TRDRNA2_177632_c0_seq2:62-1687(+)
MDCISAPAKCGFSWDLDVLFAYQTPKIVVIKDRYLGFARIAGIASLLVYCIVFRMQISQQHLDRELIHGVVETSLRQPAAYTSVNHTTFCEGGLGQALKTLPCVNLHAGDVMASSLGSDEMFLASRLKENPETPQASMSFVQDVEHHTVGISYTVWAQQLFRETGNPLYSRNIRQLKTRLLGPDGIPMSGAVRRIDRFDVIEANSLLQAAGILDFDSPTGQSSDESYRYAGVSLTLGIDCHMDKGGGISTCDYIVHQLKESAAKITIMHGLKVQERRGIRLTILISGQMGVFSWTALLDVLIKTFVMFRMVDVVLDFLMAHVMPHRSEYRTLKWQHSVDFSDYRQKDEKAVKGMMRSRTMEDLQQGHEVAPHHDSYIARFHLASHDVMHRHISPIEKRVHEAKQDVKDMLPAGELSGMNAQEGGPNGSPTTFDSHNGTGDHTWSASRDPPELLRPEDPFRLPNTDPVGHPSASSSTSRHPHRPALGLPLGVSLQMDGGEAMDQERQATIVQPNASEPNSLADSLSVLSRIDKRVCDSGTFA